jgi:hypothetical protein
VSSFTRRIQRQQVGTNANFVIVEGNGQYADAGPREKFYRGRGKMLGVTNPKAKDLIARQRREAARAARKEARQ